MVSIGELEHCILRAAMSPPDQIGANLFIPKGSPYSFRLWFSDPRLNFAMNIGSKSSPPKVPIYKPQELNTQLDAVTRLALTESTVNSSGVVLKPNKNTVTLPKVNCIFPIHNYTPITCTTHNTTPLFLSLD